MYRVAIGTSDGKRAFRIYDERSFATIDAATKAMRAHKRRGFWTWIETESGAFVPVAGAMNAKVQKSYPRG